MTRKILNLILLTVLALSIIPFVPLPTASAQETVTVYKLETSRDAWGNLWYNMNFTLTLYANVNLSESKIKVYVDIYVDDEYKYTINTSSLKYAEIEYVGGGKWAHTVLLRVTPSGDLEVYNRELKKFESTGVTLSEDNVVKFVPTIDSSKAISLTFKHVAPKFVAIRTTVPYPLNKTATTEWRIEAPDLNKDPGTVDEFDANVTLMVYTQGVLYPVPASAWVKVTFEETGKNTGVFKPKSVELYNGTSLKLGPLTGSEIYKAILYNCTGTACKPVGFNVTPYDVVEVRVIVPYTEAGTTKTDTVAKKLDAIISVATPELEIVSATLKNVTILIKDPDENRDSTIAETLTEYVKLEGVQTKKLDAKETGKDTGVFKLTLDIVDLLKNYKLINSTVNEIKVSVNTSYFNAVAVNLSYRLVELGTIKIEYNKASVSVEPTEIVVPATHRTLIITLKLTDKDLDLESGTDMYIVHIPAGTRAEKVPLVHTETKYADIILANITIEACKDTNCLPLKAVEDVRIVFYETESGVFEAKVDLGKFDWDEVKNEIGTPSKVKIIVYDLFRPDLKPTKEDIVAEISIVKAKITVDRDVIPMSDYGVKLTITVKDLAAAGYGSVDVEIKILNYTGDQIGITKTISLEETGIQTGEFKKTITIRFDAENDKILIDGTDMQAKASAALDGKLVIVYTRVPETKVEIPIRAFDADLKINGTTTVEAKYGDVIELTVVDMDRDVNAGAGNDKFDIMVGGKKVTLKETDEEGVFKAVVTVDGEIGDPGTVEITYKDPIATATTTEVIRSAEYKVTLKIKAFTGELYVNESTEEITVPPVGKLIIKVVDPDLNRNPEEKDTIADYKAKEYRLVIMKWDGTEVPIESCAKETGASTGVFVCEYDLSKLGSVSDILEGGIIQVVYVDPFTAEGVAVSKTVIVKFKAENAVIETDKDEYEVGEWIYITVKDPDRVDVDFVTVYVWSDSYPLKVPVRLVKVEPGVFEGRIHIAKSPRAGEIYAKPGDKIYIKYVEPFAYIEGEIKKDVERVKTVSVKVVVPIKYPLSVPKPEEVPEKVKFFSWTKMSYVAEIKVGDIVSLAIPVKNIDTAHRVSITAIVIVYKDGVPVDVKTTRIVLAPGEETTVFVDLPKFAEPGTYTVKVLFWKEILTPATEEKIELTITVTK